MNPPTNLETGDHVNRTYLQEVRGPPWILKIDQTSPKGIDGLYMKSMGTTNTPMGWSGESWVIVEYDTAYSGPHIVQALEVLMDKATGSDQFTERPTQTVMRRHCLIKKSLNILNQE